MRPHLLLALAFTSTLVLGALAVPKSGPIQQPTSKPAPEEAAEVPPLPPGIVARIGDAVITQGEYEAYLFSLAGFGPLRDLAYKRLLEDEAKRLGVELTQADLDAEWQREEQALIARSGGDAAQLAADLDAMGYGYEGYKRRFFINAVPKLLEDKIILKTRKIEEPAVQEYFNRVYGEGGIKVTLRHLMLTRSKMKAELIARGIPAAELTNQRLDAELDSRALKLLDELKAGADFETLAKRESADLSVHQNGGVIPNYNYKHYGKELADAVRKAEVGVVSGPTKTQAGVHLFVVEDRTVTTLEEARPEITKALLAAPASYPERAALKQRLLREHPVQLAK